MNTQHTHYLKRSWRVIVVVCSLVIAATPFIPFWGKLSALAELLRVLPNTPEIICPMGVFLIPAGVGLYEALANRIVTSAGGITYHSILYTIKTGWIISSVWSEILLELSISTYANRRCAEIRFGRGGLLRLATTV